MKNLVQAYTLSWAESIKLALDAEGIEAVLLDQQAPGYLGFAGRVRVAVVNDADLPRAQEVLRTLEPPKGEPPPSWRWHKRALLAFGAGLFLFFTTVVGLGNGWPRVVAWILLTATATAFVIGVWLVFRGYRADRLRGAVEE